MKLRSLILLLVLGCCYFLVAAKKVKVEGKEYNVTPYLRDCTKYVLCKKDVCNLMSCQYTYVFDPVTSTCTHRTRGILCDRRSPKKGNF